ncbi:TIGR03086 family metal-binding protein [Actinomadura sp. 21ATH]|uniref:TIGR03086 family metal-binding protein n=1 Tax=Actinomadura sp. 21ATH TaxID=1735444 RepID=UPI0035C0DE56
MIEDDPTAISVGRFLAHPPAKVWRALTEPELLARWLMPGDFRLEVGHRYLMNTRPVPATGFSGKVLAEVLAFEAERMLQVSWKDAERGGTDWTLTWTLRPEGRGTRLFLLHEGFDPGNPLHQRSRGIMGGGWRGHVMRALERVLGAEEEVVPMSGQAGRFRAAADGFAARIAAVPPGGWDAPSPCPGWSARDVAAHVISETRRIAATVRGTSPEPVHGVGLAAMGTPPRVESDAALGDAWARVSADLTAAIDDPACRAAKLPTPVGETPFADVAEALPEDVLVHTWDLARATGGDERLDPGLVAHVYEHLKPMDEALRQPWAFGPKLPVPAGADLQTEFLCFVGRKV